VIAQAAVLLAEGGEVWVGDETALRGFPPSRAGWSKRGQPAPVLISGRNGRRSLLGALQLQVGTREFVCTVRERCRTDDVLAAVAALAMVRPEVPKLLIWDNAHPINRTPCATRPTPRVSPSLSCPSASRS
jgi:hypothetical protein